MADAMLFFTVPVVSMSMIAVSILRRANTDKDRRVSVGVFCAGYTILMAWGLLLIR